MSLRVDWRCVWAAGCLAVAAQGPAPGGPLDWFERWDRDGDGRWSRDELPERFRERFDRIDRDGDGYVSRAEHAAALRNLPSGNPAESNRVSRAPALPDGVRIEADIPYAGTDNPRQRLDLYLPTAAPTGRLPVVVFVHGGAWRAGDKSAGRRHLADLVASGEFAGVSVGYRLTDEAIFPAQIHDCKAAIRWIRAHAEPRGWDPERIAVVGPSAGGHLVLLLGTSSGVAELEGTIGAHTGLSSRVTAVVNFFGPADLFTMGAMSRSDTAIDHDAPDSPEAQLIGGPIQQNPDAARAASPITYVSPDDPPFLHIHGTQDRLVPFGQAEAIHAALKKAGVSSTLITVDGGGHGQGFRPEVSAIVRQFLRRHLLNKGEAPQDKTLPAVGQ